jgi:uncharacterized membrane protein
MDATHVLALWLHTIAFVIAWGYYGILARIIVPALERTLDPRARASTLVAIERRALPWIVLSLVLFTVTGMYLLVADPHYQGLGNIFGSAWTRLIMVKHVLVIGLVVLAGLVDWLIRRLPDPAEAADARPTLGLVALLADGVTGLGALIALLTVAAQAAE